MAAQGADRVLEHGLEGEGPYRAACDLLLRRTPRLRAGEGGQALARLGEPLLEAGKRLVTDLRETYLPIQGPPGSGKTMLARRLPGVLPPLGPDEALEVAREAVRLGAADYLNKPYKNEELLLRISIVEQRLLLGR